MLTSHDAVRKRSARGGFMKSRALGIVTAALAVLVLASTGALPQHRDRSADDGRERRRSGSFDYYVLALSWSPTYCAARKGNRYDPQCDARRQRPYAFVLHGLWPQYERGWPQDCTSPDRGWVPGPVADRMLDIMPSRKLIFSQYRKHGTCSGLGVDRYFGLARRLYESVKIPPRFVGLADDRMLISPSDLVSEFLAANPDLRPDMIVVQCGGPGNRLREVRICFDRSGAFRACGANENQRRLCSANRMYVPPVRAGSGKDATGGPPPGIVAPPK
jgi:ribonuclease T2